jgi:predicted dehydrogenase
VRLGLIGCGWVPETLHLPSLRRLPTVDVVAAADGDLARLNRVADRFHIRHRHADYRTLLEDPLIEAVGVWVPEDRQVEVARAALDAGKHLFIEKPLVLDVKAWDRLSEHAAQSGRRIMVVGLPRRWHRLVRRAREVIRQGALGRLELIRTVLTGRSPERPGHSKGSLYHFGIQHFDVWRFLLGRDVEEIVAWESLDGSTAVVTARLPGDVLASSTFSEGTSANDEVEIHGTAGGLRVSCLRFDGFEHRPTSGHPGDLRTRVRRAAHTLRELPRGLGGARQGGDFLDSYRVGWQHFVDALHQKIEPECTLEDGRRALQVVLAARESAAVGRAVKVVS